MSVRSGLAALAFAATAAHPALALPPSEASVKGAFLERCGGCHGIEGRSAAGLVPDLREQVGYFLCTAEGRAYVVRLPNVAFSGVSDQRLAAIVNYAIFDVGGRSTPVGARRYTAAEVGRLRRDPLTATDLTAQRRLIVERVIERCPAADALRAYKAAVSDVAVAKGDMP